MISLPIGNQKFEIIRDQIAIILVTELANQYTLTNDPNLNNIKGQVEAINPEDKTELPVINVSFVRGDFGDLKANDGTNKGIYRYHIDVYVNAKTTQSAKGDNLSAIALQRIIGVIRTIIDHPIYNTLGFSKGFIWRTKINNIDIRDEGKNDALNSRMGRLTMEVQATESTDMPDGILIAGANTHVTLHETEKGYYYSV